MPVFDLMIAVLAFIFGILVLTYSSDKAVEHSVTIASAWRISPFLIGFVLVSIGTDLPEIANSIISSWAGHADLNVGDSLRSAFTQMTLILGLIALLVKDFQAPFRPCLFSLPFFSFSTPYIFNSNFIIDVNNNKSSEIRKVVRYAL